MFQMEQKSCKLQHHWLRLVLFGPVVCVKKIEMWKVYGWRGMQSDDNAQHRFLVKVNLSIHFHSWLQEIKWPVLITEDLTVTDKE
jgi:hypothetical protein